MSRDTGGPAFARARSSDPDDYRHPEVYHAQEGLLLWDYFAAHAPETPDYQTFPIKSWKVGEIVDIGQGNKEMRMVLKSESWAERAARWSAEYADAMLAERAKP